MKTEIHPKYYDAKIQCACGNVIEVGSTNKQLNTEVCAKCHPFFTGKSKHLDTTGRVEKFNKKYQNFFAKGTSEKAETKKEAEETKEVVAEKKEAKKEPKKETKKKAEKK